MHLGPLKFILPGLCLNDNTIIDLFVSEVKVNFRYDTSQDEFGPVEVITDTDTYTLEYTLQKEDGTWLIVGSEMQEQ